MSYEDVVEGAAREYARALHRILGRPNSPALADAASALLSSVEAVLEHRDAISVAQCRFSVEALRKLRVDERALLLNEYALGFGRADSPVLVMGTEHAYDLSRDGDLVNFSLESCAQHIVLLADGRPDIVARLSGGAVRLPPGRPFHLYPNDHYQEGGAHTWARLSRVVGNGTEHSPGASPGLGDRCYQVELSAFPAQRNADGRLPSDARLRFLRGTIEAFKMTSRVLLFHGKATHPGWIRAREPLISAFLGHLPEHDQWIDEGEPNRPLRHVTSGGRRVIVTRALANSSVTAGFLVRLRQLVSLGESVEAQHFIKPSENADADFDLDIEADPEAFRPRRMGGAMNRKRLVQLCESEGLGVNPQAAWTQVGPAEAIGARSRDPRIFYINHAQDIAELRRRSGPPGLVARAVEAGGIDHNGQIVARIPLDLFDEEEWLQFIRFNT